MEVRPFSVLCLVSQEDTHCGGENVLSSIITQ